MSKITKNRLFELLSARHLNNPYSRLADIPTPDNFKDIQIASARIKKAILEKRMDGTNRPLPRSETIP